MSDLTLRDELASAEAGKGASLVAFKPSISNSAATTVENALNNVIRSATDPNPVNTSRLWLSETGYNPELDTVYARSTPQTATFAIHEHLDKWGAPSRYYKWGGMSWLTNGGTAPVTALSGIAEGYKCRGIEAVARQCGDGGDGHAMEIMVGQIAGRLLLRLVAGTTEAVVRRVTRFGSRFCVGNRVEGDGLADGAVITSLTSRQGTVYTDKQVQGITVVSAGHSYKVGDILERRNGGTFTANPKFEVLSVDSDGGILTAAVIEPGNCTIAPTGSIGLQGGTGNLATFKLDLITAGLGDPVGMTVSVAATASLNSSSVRVYGKDNLNIGLLMTGSGDGGIDGTGTGYTHGLQFQAYGDSKFKKGIVFGGSGLRPDGIGVSFSSEKATRGIEFLKSCQFKDGAIVLEGQNIASDLNLGAKIATSPLQKLGFWGAEPVTKPAAILQHYSTADRTLEPYTPELRQEEFRAASDGEAKLSDLNDLRKAYENLRQHHESLAKCFNALVDSLQDMGLISK